LPTPESPMRRILKEHSWPPPPLLPAPGDPIPPLGLPLRFRPIRWRRDGRGMRGRAARHEGGGPAEV
jgi:hypothetical protein